MEIKNLFDGVYLMNKEIVEETGNEEIDEVIYDSRKGSGNKLFIALKGMDVDGHSFLKVAYDKGVRHFVVEDPVSLPEDARIYRVENSRKSLSKLAANFYGHPSRDMVVVGVTGTKGKTTVSYYIKHLLEAGGKATGLIGTIGIFYKGKMEETINTTPESLELQRILRQMRDEGVDHVVMEVSSSGLMMNRVDDILFDYGVFLNLSQDHIGEREHPTFENYRDCKARLLNMAKVSIINVDDAHAEYMKTKVTGILRTFSINHEKSDYVASELEEGASVAEMGTRFSLKHQKEEVSFYLPYPGVFNVYNALAAISVVKELGISNDVIKESLPSVTVPGRFQILDDLPGVTGILDYAHNEVALTNLLGTVKSYNPNRIILVIGTVGNRTQGRRKELALVARQYCDITILTEDNQDQEDPLKIAEEMAVFMEGGNSEVYIRPDRKEAISLAIECSKQGDVIVLAGKGHEDYNLVHGKKIPYSDEKTYKMIAKSRQSGRSE